LLDVSVGTSKVDTDMFNIKCIEMGRVAIDEALRTV
jgi:hypothetical protein